MPSPWTATKLDQISPNEPGDGELVSQLGLALKEFRLSSKNSFTTQGEHSGTGRHKIPYGTTGARPVFGKPGRIYINTDFIAQGILILQYDTGSAWQSLEVGYLNNKFTGNLTPAIDAFSSSGSGTAGNKIKTTEELLVKHLDYFDSGLSYTLYFYIQYYAETVNTTGVELKVKLDGVTLTTVNSSPGNGFNIRRVPTAGTIPITLPAVGWHTIDVTARELNSANKTFFVGSSIRIQRTLP